MDTLPTLDELMPSTREGVSGALSSSRDALEACPPRRPSSGSRGEMSLTETGQPPHAGDYAQLANQVTVELAGSLNTRRTVLRLFGLLQPGLADWAIVVVIGALKDRLAVYGGHDPGFVGTIASRTTENLGIGRVLRSGQSELLPVSVEHLTIDGLGSMIPHTALRAEAAGLLPADVLGLALTARGTTIGVLVLVRSADRGFAAEDVALAEQVADRAAIALDSARLYEERSQVASVLQAGLRPPALPAIRGVRLAARFRTAAEHMDLGGDFYDVRGSGDDWLLVLGDVCGKGVEAAVLTGRVRQSIHTAAYFDRRPSEILAALNDVLRGPVPSLLVTVACARLRLAGDGQTATIDIAVAGHPAPLILRKGGTVDQPDVSGMAIGVHPGSRYHEETVRIERGDALLMFTDGVDEARGVDGLYGIDRLIGFLPAYAGADPEVLCEAVEQDVVEHLGGRAHDDIALLAMRCGGPWGRDRRAVRP